MNWKESSDTKTYTKRLSGNYGFVFAEYGGKHDAWKNYIGSCYYAIVKGTSHCFVEEGTLEKLFEETYKLLKK